MTACVMPCSWQKTNIHADMDQYITHAKHAVKPLVTRDDIILTWLLLKTGRPQMWSTAGPGMVTILLVLGEQPLYCRVAPSKESAKFPITPPNNASTRHGKADSVAPLADVKKLASQNVIPMSKLPAIPDSVPSMLTPPLVPFGTGCNRQHAQSVGTDVSGGTGCTGSNRQLQQSVGVIGVYMCVMIMYTNLCRGYQPWHALA